MIKQKTEHYRLEKWIDGSFTIWGRGADGKPIPLMDMENQEELQEVCFLLRPPARERIPYKVWEEIAFHYALSQNAAGGFYTILLRYQEGHPERAHWKQMYMASFSKAGAYHFVWRLLGGEPRTLEDWYEALKRRWQKR